jgi:hypothetical protein
MFDCAAPSSRKVDDEQLPQLEAMLTQQFAISNSDLKQKYATLSASAQVSQQELKGLMTNYMELVNNLTDKLLDLEHIVSTMPMSISRLTVNVTKLEDMVKPMMGGSLEGLATKVQLLLASPNAASDTDAGERKHASPAKSGTMSTTEIDTICLKLEQRLELLAAEAAQKTGQFASMQEQIRTLQDQVKQSVEKLAESAQTAQSDNLWRNEQTLVKLDDLTKRVNELALHESPRKSVLSARPEQTPTDTNRQPDTNKDGESPSPTDSSPKQGSSMMTKFRSAMKSKATTSFV